MSAEQALRGGLRGARSGAARQPDHPVAKAPTAARRRGAGLEDALLQAAWEELAQVGYARLTMEGVAARAHTSKMVLYRRWPSRAEMVLAALRQHVGSVANNVPDTGGLRDDVLALLRTLSSRYSELGPDIVHGLLAELRYLPPEAFQPVRESMLTILNRAAERGEVQLEDITPRIASLPADLVRHELLVRDEPVSESVLIEIVDDIFLPLVRGRQVVASKARSGSTRRRNRTAVVHSPRAQAG